MPDASRSTSRGPAAVHVVGVGGAGMSAIATRPRRDGPPRSSGSDLDGLAVPRAAARARASTSRVGHDAANAAGDVDAVAVSTAIPDRQPRGRRGRERGRPGAAPGRRRSPPSPPPAARVAVAGTHGKTTTSSMLAAGARRGRAATRRFIIGGEVTELGTRRGVGRRRAGSSSRPTRATARSSRCRAEAAIVTNVEPDHLEHYGRLEAAAGRVRPLPGRRRRARASSAPTTRSPPALGAARRRRHLRHRRRRRLPHRRRRRPSGTGVRLHARRTPASAVGGRACRVARRCTTPATPPRRWRWRSQLGVAVRRRPARRLARFGGVARRFELRGEAAGVTFVDDYAHLPDRGARPRWPPPRAGGWGRVVCVLPAPPLQPHRGAVAGLRRRLRRRRPAGRHRHLRRRARRPGPGVTGKLVVDAVLDAHPWRRVAWLPAPRRRRRATSASAPRPATCASRSAPAT